MSIKCAWCGSPIHIGDPVTLYIALKSSAVPKHAVRYANNEQCFVGCLRMDCAQTGADRQGFWLPPGRVERVPSPIEMLLSQGNAATAIIVNDLSDQSDLGRVLK